jgi:Putative prokaryotic signal transducing protein
MNRWVHLATAPDQLTAEMWVSMLRDAGLSAMIRPSDAVSFLGVSAYGCRVQVVEEDLQEAREMLAGEIDSVSEDD